MYATTFNAIERHLAHRESRKAIRLLVDNPKIITYHNAEGDTVLHKAVFYGNEMIATWLLNYGVDLLSKDQYDETPLHLAFRIREGALAALLYHYEKQIPENPMEAKNLQLYTTCFLKDRPDKWRQAEIEVFHTRSGAFSKDRLAVPKRTLDLTLANLGREPREAKVSDVSDLSSVLLSRADDDTTLGESGGAGLRYRIVFGAARAPRSDDSPLLSRKSNHDVK